MYSSKGEICWYSSSHAVLENRQRVALSRGRSFCSCSQFGSSTAAPNSRPSRARQNEPYSNHCQYVRARAQTARSKMASKERVTQMKRWSQHLAQISPTKKAPSKLDEGQYKVLRKIGGTCHFQKPRQQPFAAVLLGGSHR